MPTKFSVAWIGIRLFFMASSVVLAAGAPAPAAAEQTLPGLPAVLGELRKGGLIIYMRHTVTEHAEASEAAEDLARCETQRNLSAAGRAEARQIGSAIKTLGIPIGMVLASPFCRTQATAQLAFGRYTVGPDLYFAIGSDATETQRLAQALRQMLAAVPERGSNTVLISHSANLFEAAGIFPKPEGVAIVFRPLPGGRFEALARILPDDWRAGASRHGLPGR